MSLATEAFILVNAGFRTGGYCVNWRDLGYA